MVVLRDGQVGSADAGNNLHGLYGSIANWIPNSTLEPYFMWRLQPHVKSELGPLGQPGYESERSALAGQGPRVRLQHQYRLRTRAALATDRVDAWAGHWLLGYSFPDAGRIAPAGGRIQLRHRRRQSARRPANTFQLLYPTRA